MDKLIIRKGFMIVVGCLIYAIGYYHRNCTSTLSVPMGKALHVDSSGMIKLTAMYFWPYAIIQPFVGSISDVIEVSYFLSGSLLLAGVSTLLCGLSRSYALTCVARCFTGFACGSFYVPICRTFAQWFSPKAFPYAQSVMIAFGDIGAILAQGPLKTASTDSKWSIPFYVGSGISFFLAIVAFFTIKSSPKSLESGELTEKRKSFKEFLASLGQNVKECMKFRDFWLLSLWKFLAPAMYSTVSSNVGINFLHNGLHYDLGKAQYYITITSIACAVGSPVLAGLSHLLHTRKWLLFAMTLLAIGVEIIFAIFEKGFSNGVVILLLFVFALSTGAALTLAAILFKEMLRKEMVGTLLGCGNLFMMIGTFIQQMIVGAVVKKYESQSGGSETISFDAFRYGVWTFAAIVCFVSLFFLVFVKDSYKKAIEGETNVTTPKEVLSKTDPLLSEESKEDYISNNGHPSTTV